MLSFIFNKVIEEEVILGRTSLMLGGGGHGVLTLVKRFKEMNIPLVCTNPIKKKDDGVANWSVRWRIGVWGGGNRRKLNNMSNPSISLFVFRIDA